MPGDPVVCCIVFVLRLRYFSAMDSIVEDEPADTNDGKVTLRGNENDGSEKVSDEAL